jgi:hypothetical protein
VRFRSDSPIPQHRFPLPWAVEETDACFIVKDRGGQKLAYNLGRRSEDKLLPREAVALIFSTPDSDAGRTRQQVERRGDISNDAVDAVLSIIPAKVLAGESPYHRRRVVLLRELH